MCHIFGRDGPSPWKRNSCIPERILLQRRCDTIWPWKLLRTVLLFSCSGKELFLKDQSAGKRDVSVSTTAVNPCLQGFKEFCLPTHAEVPTPCPQSIENWAKKVRRQVISWAPHRSLLHCHMLFLNHFSSWSLFFYYHLINIKA